MNKPKCITNSNGDKEWWLNGKWHRKNGPAREFKNGTKHWYLNDKRHREDGPAVERANGTKYWYLNGNFHREDGPAVEYADGTKQWWLNDERVHPETTVDLWLSRGVFCWYDQTSGCLNFGEKDE